MADDAKINALDDRIAAGVKSVFSDGDRVEFASTDELIKARNHISAQSRPRLKPIRLRLSRNV